MEDKKEKPTSTRIQCEKPIYINILKTIENTGFFKWRFLHVYIIYSNLGGNIYDFEF